MIARVLAVAVAAALLGGCTSSASPGVPTARPTSTAPPPSAANTAPVVAGPTRAVGAPSCPLAATPFVRNTMGMRLGRIEALRSGGRVVGCRFYALQGSPLHASEHLPGPNQPVVEIVTDRYASAAAAHNAFVSLATQGRNAQQIGLGRALGVCFQTDFYPKDHGADWACAASVGTTAVVVRTVDTTGTFSTAVVTRRVLSHV